MPPVTDTEVVSRSASVRCALLELAIEDEHIDNCPEHVTEVVTGTAEPMEVDDKEVLQGQRTGSVLGTRYQWVGAVK